MLTAIRDKAVAAVFFDPQYRTNMDYLDYGNEGVRMKGRIELSQMNDEQIITFIKQIERILKRSGYCFLWVDTFTLGCGIIQKWIGDTSLRMVDIIVWYKDTFGMGARSRA